jgi:ferredoxin
MEMKQKVWLIASFVIAALIVVLGLICEPQPDEQIGFKFSVDMNIKQIAPTLGVTGKGLARELNLPLDVSKSSSLQDLGISQEQLDHASIHILSHSSSSLKYYIFAALVFFGLVYLMRVGRPDNADVKKRKLWYPRLPYLSTLIISVLVCGFALGKSPNPMEGTVKVFKSMVGLYPDVTEKVFILVFFIALVIIGNKLVCGWACPFGALQELIHSLPVLRKIKKRKLPFMVSNTIRAGLFVLTLVFLFDIVGGKKGYVIYHLLNPFNLFNLDFDGEWMIMATVITALVLSLFVYRPFCHFVCPFGLISWVAERLSIMRVRINHEKCTSCGACVRACPSEAAKGIVEGKLFGADCFSCARCLKVCPQDAIRYSFVFSRPPRETGQAS